MAALEFVAKAYHVERVLKLEEQLAATEDALVAAKAELAIERTLANNADQLAMSEADARRSWQDSHNRTLRAVMQAVSDGSLNATYAQKWLDGDLPEVVREMLAERAIPAGTTFENVEAARVRGVLLRGVSLARSEREALDASYACEFLESLIEASPASVISKHNVTHAYRASSGDVVAHARLHGWIPPR